MEFLVLGIFVLALSSLALFPTYLIAKRKPKVIYTLLPSFGLLVLSIVLSLLSRMPLEPGSWADLVFILYALITFYAFILSFIGAFALNYYFKHKK